MSSWLTGGHGTIADRLNSQWTFLLLLLTALIIFLLPTVVPTISCLCPSHFPKTWIDYVHRECAYFSGDNLDSEYTLWGMSITYKGSISSLVLGAPVLFVYLALAVLMPFLLFHPFEVLFGIQAGEVTHRLKELREESKENTLERKELRYLVNIPLDMKLTGGKQVTSVITLTRKTFSALLALVVSLYIFVVLDPLTDSSLDGNLTAISGNFRAHSNCSVYMNKRPQDHIPNHTLLCVHPINLAYSRVFIFWAIYMLCLFIINVTDLLLTTAMIFTPGIRDRKLTTFLLTNNPDDFFIMDNSPIILEPDFSTFIGSDGYLLLLTASQKSNDSVWADIATILWREYKSAKQKQLQDMGLDEGSVYATTKYEMANKKKVKDAKFRHLTL